MISGNRSGHRPFIRAAVVGNQRENDILIKQGVAGHRLGGHVPGKRRHSPGGLDGDDIVVIVIPIRGQFHKQTATGRSIVRQVSRSGNHGGVRTGNRANDGPVVVINRTRTVRDQSHGERFIDQGFPGPGGRRRCPVDRWRNYAGSDGYSVSGSITRVIGQVKPQPGTAAEAAFIKNMRSPRNHRAMVAGNRTGNRPDIPGSGAVTVSD